MAAPIDLRNDFDASHCGASRRGPGTRPRAVVCWRWPRSTMVAAGRMRRGSAASVCRSFATGCCLQRPRTGRAGRWASHRAHPRSSTRCSLAEVVEAGPVPAVDGVVRLRGGSWRTSGQRVEGTGFAKISARPRHYAQNELAVEAFKKTSPPLAKIRARLPKGVEIELWWQDEARIGQKNKLTRRWADVARARGRPATSAPNGPISSARSVPRTPGWSCPGATPTPRHLRDQWPSKCGHWH